MDKRMNRLYVGRLQFERPSGNPGVKESEVGRGVFRKDYGRLLHAPSFRRLQGKTQLFPGSQSDYFRNRLTHSLEVAQIARGIACRLNATDVPRHFGRASIDEDLVEFASIAHDLGHPPFGHNGEHALDEVMKEHGGFEGNAQSLRILAHVERKLVNTDGGVGAAYGLDLTYRSLAAVLKYDKCIPQERAPNTPLIKGYYSTEAALVREIKRRVAPKYPVGEPFKTIECAIMDVADDIAYSSYDLEDSLHANFYTPLDLANELLNNEAVQQSVVEKTNKALAKERYRLIRNDNELLEVIASAFNLMIAGRAETAMKRMKSKRLNAAERSLMVGIESFVPNKAVSEVGLLRTKVTAERVGRLIEAVELVPNQAYPQLSRIRLRRAELLQVEVMKHLNYELVVRSPRLAVVEHRGKDIVQRIFEAIATSNGSLLPNDWRARYAEVDRTGGSALRVVCDFVAGMTDRYAFEFYSRLFGDESTIYKPI